MHSTTIPRFCRAAVSTVAVLAFAGPFLPSLARAQDAEAKHVHTKKGFLDFPAKSAFRPGYSVLIRTQDDISMRVHAKELIAGDVYTFWIGVTDPDGSHYGGRVDARVVDASGIVNLKVEVEVGEVVGDFHPDGIPNLAEGELRNPLTSTIMLVIRNHGPASSNPADLYQQMYTHQTYNPEASDFGITIHDPSAP
jgi:hypothetical protein